MAQDALTALAEEVLQIARGQLLVNLRFLDRALFEIKPLPGPLWDLATDGAHLMYRPAALLRRYRDERGYAVRAVMHTMLHCLFRHMIVSDEIDRPLWDLACDMAVEAMIQELNLPQVPPRPLPVLEVQPYTAEKLYRHMKDNPPSPRELEAWRGVYALDDHTPWYLRVGVAGAGEGVAAPEEGGASPMTEAQARLWQDIAQRLQTDLETFSKSRGDEAGKLLQSLRAINREKTDYAAFLRRFATRAEVLRVSPDEFDYNFYTYGAQLYGDMPLIEPLEYREDKRVRDLVIAIDTSGSVMGDQVQAFLQKTWNIVKSQETFDRRFVLHIIQCDADIQEDAVVTDQESFDRYLSTMVLRGFGGTDFRPVFDYVAHLREKGELRRMKGLIYFTDGCGVYPHRPPDYQTAFVFLEDDRFALPAAPAWAMKVVIDGEQLRLQGRTQP